MKRFFMSVSLVVLLGATGPKANDQINTPENPKLIPDSIVVTANRKATPAKEIASSITVITDKDIAASQPAMVSDILRTVPGIDVVQSGGLGKTTSVFMRGANSHHTLVIIDGVEMNDPSTPNGYFDFAHLNVDNIQRIEILRGSQSVLYGSDAIGGVIQIFTKRGFDKPSLEIQAETGSYNTYNESVHLSGSANNVDYSLFLARKDSDGFSATTDTTGTEEDDGYENSEIAAHIGYSLSDKFEVNLTGKYIDGKADIDGFGSIPEDPNATNESRIKSFSLSIDKYITDDFWKPSFGIYASDREFISTNGTDPDHPNDTSISNYFGSRLKLSTLHTLRLRTNNRLTLGAETELEKYNSDYYSESAWGSYADTVTEVDSRISSLFALEEISVNNRWFNTIGLRYDHLNSLEDSSKTVFTYRLTSTYIFDELDLKLKTNYGTGFKSPSLFQIYNDAYGNPELKAEESTSWELGFEKGFNNISFGATYFNTEFENLIVTVLVDPVNYIYKPINVDKAKSKGVEVSGELMIGKTSFKADYTYNKAVDTTDTQLLRRPENKFSISGRHKFNDKLQLEAKLINVGERNDYGLSEPIDSYTLLNANISYNVYKNIILTGKILNLLDEDYQEVFGYRTSSRAFYLSVKAEL